MKIDVEFCFQTNLGFAFITVIDRCEFIEDQANDMLNAISFQTYILVVVVLWLTETFKWNLVPT
ncbi:hypothetical protein BDFB_014834 [Asbolus verrucosus]|uniref:Uncharacterized protein n=1 Tax=Asbolus verrucosus TaxID=1661398 RepID=A0A482V8V5_ASBVE|nr:hypothetical protein BDFB_014834 [Asbolus verrucosus]